MPWPSCQIPPEVDLDLGDLVAIEAEDLRVAKRGPIAPARLVGDTDLIAGLDQPDDLELLERVGVGPAALEVGRAVDAVVARAVEREVAAEDALEEVAVARLVGAVVIAHSLLSIARRHVSLLVVSLHRDHRPGQNSSPTPCSERHREPRAVASSRSATGASPRRDV